MLMLLPAEGERFLKQRNLSAVIQAVLDDSVNKEVEVVVPSGYGFGQGSIALLLHRACQACCVFEQAPGSFAPSFRRGIRDARPVRFCTVPSRHGGSV